MPIYAFQHGSGAFGPELRRNGQRVDPLCRPPDALIAMLVELAVVDGAERHGELVRDLSSERGRLASPALTRMRMRVT